MGFRLFFQQLFLILKKHMFLQVVIAIFLGVLVGTLAPAFGAHLKFIAIIFIHFIKMVITPIVFVSIILGVNSHKGEGGLGVLAFRTLVYFEIMSIVSVLIALFFMLVLKPGTGFNITAFQNIDVTKYKNAVSNTGGFEDFLINLIPENVVSTLAGDNLLAVVVLAAIIGISIFKLEKSDKIISFFYQVNAIFFKMIGLISKVSPIAAFAAIAATVGQNGVKSLSLLASFILVIILCMITFCLLLCIIAKIYGLKPIKLIKYIKEELFIALGTSSSESVFPQLMQKLEYFGCSKKIVGFVLPVGYAFNLDGTAIYVTAGVFFIQQAYNIPISFSELALIIFTILIVSKGAAGVAGAGFVTLSAVLAALPQQFIPLEGLALLLGIDRMMSDSRTVTNIVGNAIGTIIIAKAEGEFEERGLHRTPLEPVE